MGRTVRFGPGRLESLTLEYRAHVTEAQLTGTYRVYCGWGNEHTFEVDTGWKPMGSRVVLTDEAVASRMLEDELDYAWTDPCDDLDEEPYNLEEYMMEKREAAR